MPIALYFGDSVVYIIEKPSQKDLSEAVRFDEDGSFHEEESFCFSNSCSGLANTLVYETSKHFSAVKSQKSYFRKTN